MKNHLLTLWIAAALTAKGAAAAPDSPSRATNRVAITAQLIAGLAAEARTNQPALRAADERVAAAIFNVQSVRHWEDPMARFGGTVFSDNGMDAAQQGNLTYGVEQKLPLWGKPELARRVARAEVATQQATYASRVQWLQRDVAKALFRIALAERVIEIGEQDLAWLDTMIAMTEEKYRGGMATQTELIQLQNEKSKRADLLRTERNKRVHERLTLNRLVNRDLHASWPEFELPPIAAPVLDQPRLNELALRFEPRLLVLRQEKNQADATTRLVRRQRLPDVSLGIEGRQFSGDGGFREGMFTVGVNLPWFNRDRYRSDVRREEAKSRALEADLAELALSVQEDVHHLTVDLDAARREALLYRDEILPRTRQALASVRAAWETNRGMLRDMLENRRMLLESQLMFARAVTEQHQLLADLATICGVRSLESLENELKRSAAGIPPAKP
jgi:cobalt-zinc-cadmium efflux system outer membrane protein